MDGQILELGFQQWYREGREAEHTNTLREQKRADDAEKELAQANSYIKELEAKLAQQNS